MSGRQHGAPRWAAWATRLLLVAAAGLLWASFGLPYWSMRVRAPQYPKGLSLQVYPDRLEGDVQEIDTLNHYIGMRPLAQGAQFERRLARPIGLMAGLGLVLAALFRIRRVPLLVLPALCFPVVFAGDLYWWLRRFGLNLNPHAPLNRSIKPFIPTLVGEGRVGQFDSVAWFAEGFQLSVAASVCILLALVLWGCRRPGAPVAMAALAAALCWASAAHAQTLTVGPGGAASIADALEAAAPGDTILVQGGVHRGPLVVDRAVRLLGEGQPILDGGGLGTVVRLAAPDIHLQGFTIRGSGDRLAADDAGVLVEGARAVVEANALEDVLFGIDVRRAPGTVLRRNRLRGKALPVARRGDLIRIWYSDGVTIEGNELAEGRDAVLWYSQDLTVRDNTVTRARYGLHVMYCHGATVIGNRLSDNSVGAYLMYSRRLRVTGNRLTGNRGPSGFGIGLKDMTETVVEANLIADNRAGLFLDGVTGDFRGNIVAYNDTGLTVVPTAQGNRFTENSFIENGRQVRIEGIGERSTNRWAGNFWSDYRGYDAAGDGVGDLPYEAVAWFEHLTDRYPALRLYTGSLVVEALELGARLFPIFAPRPLLVDASPRMRPPVAAAAGRHG